MNLNNSLIQVVGISLLWAMLLNAANTTGNFPLNDDWNYARSAQLLAEQSRLLITCWNCSTNLVQILYGALLSKIFGFSFELLRVSTWIAGLAACIFSYLLVKETTRRSILAVAAALTVMTNAIFFNLASTFMTDVPFLAVLTASMFFAVRALRGENGKDYWFAVALALISTFLRQYGVVFLALFVITYAIGRLKDLKLLALSTGVLLVPVALLLSFRSWLEACGLPGCYNVWIVYIKQSLGAGFSSLFGTMLFNYLTEVIYLGLFVLPFTIACVPFVFKELIKKEQIFALVCAVELMLCLLIGLSVKGLMMPLTSNVLYPGGVGPILLADINTGNAPATLGFAFWLLITLLACKGVSISFALCISRFLSLKRQGLLGKFLAFGTQFRSGSDGRVAGEDASASGSDDLAHGDNLETSAEWKITFLFGAFVVTYLGILSFTGLIDRYILPSVPAMFVVLGQLAGRPSEQAKLSLVWHKNWLFLTMTGASLVTLLFLGSFSIAATHDYFAVNRARWEAANYAVRDLKIDPKTVEGGWEFNGWYFYDLPQGANATPPHDLSMKRGDEFAISDGTPENYSVVRVWNVGRCLPSTVKRVNLLRKESMMELAE